MFFPNKAGNVIASNADVLRGSSRVSSPTRGEETRDEPLRTSALEARNVIADEKCLDHSGTAFGLFQS